MTKERCEIISKVKQMAKSRGLGPERVNCPVEITCDGSHCIYLAEPDTNWGDKQLQKFYNRLEKTVNDN